MSAWPRPTAKQRYTAGRLCPAPFLQWAGAGGPHFLPCMQRAWARAVHGVGVGAWLGGGGCCGRTMRAHVHSPGCACGGPFFAKRGSSGGRGGRGQGAGVSVGAHLGRSQPAPSLSRGWVGGLRKRGQAGHQRRLCACVRAAAAALAAACCFLDTSRRGLCDGTGWLGG